MAKHINPDFLFNDLRRNIAFLIFEIAKNSQVFPIIIQNIHSLKNPYLTSHFKNYLSREILLFKMIKAMEMGFFVCPNKKDFLNFLNLLNEPFSNFESNRLFIKYAKILGYHKNIFPNRRIEKRETNCTDDAVGKRLNENNSYRIMYLILLNEHIFKGVKQLVSQLEELQQFKDYLEDRKHIKVLDRMKPTNKELESYLKYYLNLSINNNNNNNNNNNKCVIILNIAYTRALSGYVYEGLFLMNQKNGDKIEVGSTALLNQIRHTFKNDVIIYILCTQVHPDDDSISLQHDIRAFDDLIVGEDIFILHVHSIMRNLKSSFAHWITNIEIADQYLSSVDLCNDLIKLAIEFERQGLGEIVYTKNFLNAPLSLKKEKPISSFVITNCSLILLKLSQGIDDTYELQSYLIKETEPHWRATYLVCEIEEDSRIIRIKNSAIKHINRELKTNTRGYSGHLFMFGRGSPSNGNTYERHDNPEIWINFLIRECVSHMNNSNLILPKIFILQAESSINNLLPKIELPPETMVIIWNNPHFMRELTQMFKNDLKYLNFDQRIEVLARESFCKFYTSMTRPVFIATDTA